MPVLHESVNLALGQEPDAIDALVSYLPKTKWGLPAFPLPPPRDECERTGLLVGRVLSNSDGTLVVSHGRNSYCQAVFAPPLSIKYRAALVYCSDFRTIRTGNAETVLEILSAHVQVLLECSFYATPGDLKTVPLANIAGPQKQSTKHLVVQARVTAKSPIMGTGRKARFLLEISSVTKTVEKDAVAVFVIFVGAHALEWWPFLLVGSAFCFAGLTRAKLPDFNNQYVLKVSDNTVSIYDCPSTIVCSESTNQIVSDTSAALIEDFPKRQYSPPPTKRVRSAHVLRPLGNPMGSPVSANRSGFSWSQRAVTYQGVITEVLSDGRFRLDDVVYLHLGGEYAWCGGGEKTMACFRVGARIEALNVLIAFQRGVPTTVFPTARTVVNIVYFGNVPQCGIVQTRKWHRSPWFRYWRHLRPTLVLWAQELYDALSRKFRSWLASTQGEGSELAPSITQDPEFADRMLGSDDGVGLVEFLMELLTGTRNLFQQSQAPTHFYSDFLKWNYFLPGQCHGEIQNSPYPATIAELSAAVKARCSASSSAKASRFTSICRSDYSPVRTEVFSEKDLSNTLCSAGGQSIEISREAENSCRSDIVLIGLLEGCSNDTATAQISDATKSIPVEFTGSLDPSLLGAVIVVQSFQFIVEFFPHTVSGHTTLILNPADMKVLIDGPYIDFDSDIDILSNNNYEENHQQIFSRDASLRLHATQAQSGEPELPSLSPFNCETDEYPLAAICVQQVSSITKHADGQSRFRINGYLIAFCKSRSKCAWEFLGRGHAFWKCCLVVHGDAASKIRASLREGQLYGIGCSDFGDCDNIQELCEKRAEQAMTKGRPLLLFSRSSQNGLWVQDLQAGKRMHFITDMQPKATLDADLGKQTDVPENSVNLRRTVDDFVNHLRLQTRHSLTKTFLSEWNSSEALSAGSEVSDDSEVPNGSVDYVMAVEGVFLHAETLRGASRIGGAKPDKLTANRRFVLREKQTSVVTFHVVFTATLAIPYGLIPGSTLQILNVLRGAPGKNGEILFTATEMTRVIRIPCDNWSNPQPSLCCHRPLLDNKSLLLRFPSCFLWSFRAAAKKSSERGSFKICGVVRVNLVELKEVKFFVNYHQAGCGNCKLADGTGWCASAWAKATIEDGTTRGEVTCNTFRSTMELLGATEEDSRIMRKELPRWQPARDMLTNWETANSFCTSDSRADLALKHLVDKFPRSAHILVRNLNSGSGIVGNSSSPTIDEAELRGHNLGYGQRLWTAESSPIHQVRVEALAVFEEDFWLASRGENVNSNWISVRERYRGKFD